MDGWKQYNGTWYPRVTTILGSTKGTNERLEAWAKANPDFDLNQAALVGTLMHYRILNRLSPIQLELRDEVPMHKWPSNLLDIINAKEEQFNYLKLKIGNPRLIEHRVLAGGQYPYCGTLDIEAPIDGQVTIADLKSSKRPVKDHELQLAAYYHARKMVGGKATNGALCYLRVSDVEMVELENDEMEENVFKFFDRARSFYRNMK